MSADPGSTHADAKELYWKIYLPRFVGLIVVGALVSVAVYQVLKDPYSSEIVPVVRDGKIFYGLKCDYSGMFRTYDVLMEPIVADASVLNRRACPATYEDAVRKRAGTDPKG